MRMAKNKMLLLYYCQSLLKKTMMHLTSGKFKESQLCNAQSQHYKHLKSVILSI